MNEGEKNVLPAIQSQLINHSTQEDGENNLFFPEENAYQRIKIFFETNELIPKLPQGEIYIGDRFKKSLSELFNLSGDFIFDYKQETQTQLEDRGNEEKLSQVGVGDYVFFRTFLPGQQEDIPVLFFAKVIGFSGDNIGNNTEEKNSKKFIFRRDSCFIICPNKISLNVRELQIDQTTINNLFPHGIIIDSGKISLISRIKAEEIDAVEKFFIPYAMSRYLRQKIYPQLPEPTKDRLLFYEADNNTSYLFSILDKTERETLEYLKSLKDNNSLEFTKYSRYFNILETRVKERDEELRREKEKKEKNERFFQFLEAFGFKKAYLYQEFLPYYFAVIDHLLSLLSNDLNDKARKENLMNSFIFFKQDLEDNPNDYLFEKNLHANPLDVEKIKENEAIFTDNVLSFLGLLPSNLSPDQQKKILTSIQRLFAGYFHPDSNLLPNVPKKIRERFFQAGFHYFSKYTRG